MAAGLLLFRVEANVDLSVTPADFTVSGDRGDFLGHAVATGDINGDTIQDLVIGAPLGTPPGGSTQTGLAYVVYGDGSLPAGIDLSANSADVTVYGEGGINFLGAAVTAGDVNGDTTDDLIVSAPIANGGRGRIYIIYGGPTVPAVTDLSTGSADVTVTGAGSSGLLGFGLAAGDVNGDTTDDLIAGALGVDAGAGAGYVIYGGPSLPSTINLGTTSADVTVLGGAAGDNLGSSIAAGDVDGDTVADIIVGAPLASPAGGSAAGETYVIYGSGSLPATIDLSSVSADLTVSGDDPDDESGLDVGTGDIDGDTTQDLIIGARLADPPGGIDAGETYVIFGGGSLPAAIDLNSTSADVTVYGDNAGDTLGFSVGSGDVGGDTADDLIIGAPEADPDGRQDAGKSYVIFGGAGLASVTDLDIDLYGLVTIAGVDDGDLLGRAVAAGDIDGDTTADLIIGAPEAFPAGGFGAGETYVFFTSSPKPSPTPCGFPGPLCTNTPTPTDTPTPTNTPTPTATPTPTNTPTASPTPTITPTPCGFPTATCTPTVTPTKIAIDGNLSGVFDILVHDGTKTDQSFYCKARTDHDTSAVDASGGEALKTASTCYLDTPGQEAPGDKVPTDPNIDLAGPPPPPPYGNAGPVKGNGSYCPTGSGGCTDVLGNPMPEDRAVVATCFPSQGGILGPNVIWVTTVDNVKVDVANQSGTVDIHYGQGILECDSKAPKGPPTATFSINLTRYDQQPYDNVTSVDSDGDGCPDAFELDKRRAKKDCGDDPWNPHDSDLNFNASYSITIEVRRADTCHSGQPSGPAPVGCDPPAVDQDIAAGSYYNCQAFLDHNLGDNSVTGKAFCYTDNPVTAVNLEGNGGAIDCAPFPSANPEDCGDGLPGSPPPGPFADNDGETTPGVITGLLDKGSNRLILDVCFSGRANPLEGPNLYMRLDLDAHTGLGSADVWRNRFSCDKPLPADTPTENDVPVSVAEQNDANCSFTTSDPACYDVDQDGCSARQELGPNAFQGGQRDPFNKHDHMDINKDGTINVPDDIIGTALLFGPAQKGDQGNVGPRMNGSVSWAHRNGDSSIGIPDDILGVAAQFGHNCE